MCVCTMTMRDEKCTGRTTTGSGIKEKLVLSLPHPRRRVSFHDLAELLEECVRNDACTRVDREFEFADFRIDILHELNDEVDQLTLLHVLRVEVGDEERQRVALNTHSTATAA